jgi:hypothetical protein
LISFPFFAGDIFAYLMMGTLGEKLGRKTAFEPPLSLALNSRAE